MAYYGRMEDLPPAEVRYQNNCVDGKCSDCGNCCVDLLPLTKGELEIIKRYAKKHELKPHRQAPFWDPKATDFSCPFRNQHTKSCDIYPARPQICRSFSCAKPIADAIHDRDEIHKGRKVYSLRYEIFGISDCVDLIAAVCAKRSGLV